MDEALERSNLEESRTADGTRGENFETGLVLLVIAVAVLFGCIVSPPSLMDDVDAVQAQIARNMLDSGDWVIARPDGVPYVEKSPLIYWLMAASFRVFGVHDWSARIPVALAPVLLVWVTSLYRRWAFGVRAGFYAGLVLATSVGLFLFTRIQIPDVMLTLAICVAFGRSSGPRTIAKSRRARTKCLSSSPSAGVLMSSSARFSVESIAVG